MLYEDILNRVLSAIPDKVREGFAEANELVASISRASSNFHRGLLSNLNVSEIDIFIPKLPQYLSQGNEAFMWYDSQEDSPENKNAYLSYLKAKFESLPRLRVYDGDHPHSSLQTTLNEYSLKGIISVFNCIESDNII
jgi:hypothetical protein